MYKIEHLTQKSNFTREGKWEMVITQLKYADNLYPTMEIALKMLLKIAAAYEEPESDYRIVEEK